MILTSLVVTSPASPAQAACSVTVTTKNNLFGTFTGHVVWSGCRAAGDDTVCVQHEIGYNSWYTTRCHTTGLTNQGTADSFPQACNANYAGHWRGWARIGAVGYAGGDRWCP